MNAEQRRVRHERTAALAVQRKARHPLTIAVTSGKGGVGKTSVAVNLAVALAQRGARVTLADLDLGLANADLLLGVPVSYTLTHALAGARSLEEVCADGPAGLRFVPGASGSAAHTNMTEFERRNLVLQLQRLRPASDVLVLDCGAGIARNVLSFAEAADHVLVVTTPEPTALADAYAIIKVLHTDGYQGRLGLFVNMADSPEQAREVSCRVVRVAQRFLRLSVAERGFMVHDREVLAAIRNRTPFAVGSPESDAAVSISALAATYVRSRADLNGRGRLLERIAQLFL